MSRYSPETITEAVNACVAALSLEDLQADKAYDLEAALYNNHIPEEVDEFIETYHPNGEELAAMTWQAYLQRARELARERHPLPGAIDHPDLEIIEGDDCLWVPTYVPIPLHDIRNYDREGAA